MGQHMITHQPVPLESPEKVFDSLSSVLSVYESQWRPEKREKSRIEMVVPVAVKLLDVSRVQIGQSFSAITKDISMGGLCILCTDPCQATFALVEFNSEALEEPIKLMFKICHTTVIGPFTMIGGGFVANWNGD